MDEFDRLLEIAKKTITQNDLERLTKGKKTVVKLWPKFSIGFEVEVSYTGDNSGYVSDYDIEERFNEEWDEADEREQIYNNMDMSTEIDIGELSERLQSTESFMDGVDIDDFMQSANKEYFIKPVYGWADPVVVFQLNALMMMKMALTGKLEPNLYNYYSILSELSYARSTRQLDSNAQNYQKMMGFAQKCMNLLTQYRRQREDFIVKALEGEGGLGAPRSSYLLRSAKPNTSFLPNIQDLFDEYSKLTLYDDLLDINTLSYKDTPQAEKYKAGVYSRKGVIYKLKRGPVEVMDWLYTEYLEGNDSTSKTIPPITSGGQAFDLLKFYHPMDDDSSKPDWDNEVDDEYVADTVAEDNLDEVNSELETAYNEEVDAQYERRRDIMREDIRINMVSEGPDSETALEEVQRYFEDVDGVDEITEDSSVSPSGGEIISKVFHGREGLARSMEWLEEVFEIIKDNSVLETNNSTGLHINIGTFTSQMAGAKKITTGMGEFIVPSYKELDLFKLAVFLGEGYMLNIFNRTQNTYAAKVLQRLSSAGSLQDVLVMDSRQIEKFGLDKVRQALQEAMAKTAAKYSTINFTKLNHGSYLEFRFAGNANYEEDLPKVKQSIARIILAVAAAMDEDLFKEDYIKKTLKILSENYKPLVNDSNIPDNIRKEFSQLNENVKLYVGQVIRNAPNSQPKLAYIEQMATSGIWYTSLTQDKKMSPITKARIAKLLHSVLLKISTEGERVRAYKAIKEKKNPNIDMKGAKLVLFGPSGRPNLYKNTPSVKPR